MLRNARHSSTKLLQRPWPLTHTEHFFTVACGGALCSKQAQLNRQSKVINKLFGERITGSKKRWYPSTTAAGTTPSNNAALFNVSQFGKTSRSNGRSTTRRMTVLNKLFMKHITDLLATGEVSEAILGRGLQVTRVKISPDFACINVYWLGNGEVTADALLERELQRCSGLLRHELSQLMLMGEVPRVHFARERKFTNIAEVDALLRNMDLREETEEVEETSAGQDADSANRVEQNYQLAANIMQREFYGRSVTAPLEERVAADDAERLPEMRHDVLGLDHQHIMLKILTKMRKSKQAWEQHNQQQLDAASSATPAAVAETLERVNQKLAAAAQNATKFEQFLARRHARRNTPERKKHDRTAEWLDESAVQAAMDVAIEASLTPMQRRLMEAEDYLHEEGEQYERK